MQGGYNTSSSNQAPQQPAWQMPESSAAPANNGYAAAPASPYEAAPATATYETAAVPQQGGMEVSGTTTGTPAGGALPASLTTAGGYRPGSTGRPLDSGVQNAGYQQPSTGYSTGGTMYR